VCAYSARAREAGTVSVPIDWSKLTTRLRPASFTVENVGKKATPDPWRDYWKTRQKISKAAYAAIRKMIA
jgi:bifunctional non-homologous end joining protein LigD